MGPKSALDISRSLARLMFPSCHVCHILTCVPQDAALTEDFLANQVDGTYHNEDEKNENSKLCAMHAATLSHLIDCDEEARGGVGSQMKSDPLNKEVPSCAGAGSGSREV